MKVNYTDSEKYRYAQEQYLNFINKVDSIANGYKQVDIHAPKAIKNFVCYVWGQLDYRYISSVHYFDRKSFCTYLSDLVSFLNKLPMCISTQKAYCAATKEQYIYKQREDEKKEYFRFINKINNINDTYSINKMDLETGLELFACKMWGVLFMNEIHPSYRYDFRVYYSFLAAFVESNSKKVQITEYN